MAIEGEIERPDIIVFADPQWELKATYKYLHKLMDAVNRAGIPMVVDTVGDIYADTMQSAKTGDRAPSMPFYSEDMGDEGIVGRQCTNDYKIDVVRKVARGFLGLKPRQRLKTKLVMWKGITTDEIERISISKIKTEEYRYPLFDLGMDRLDCMNWLEQHGYGVPPKSSCVGCPFHSRQTWVDIYKQFPDEFQKAVKLDNAIRNHKKFNSKLYLHKDRVPLLEAVTRDVNQGDMFDYEGFANDCSGTCGV